MRHKHVVIFEMSIILNLCYVIVFQKVIYTYIYVCKYLYIFTILICYICIQIAMITVQQLTFACFDFYMCYSVILKTKVCYSLIKCYYNSHLHPNTQEGMLSARQVYMMSSRPVWTNKVMCLRRKQKIKD